MDNRIFLFLATILSGFALIKVNLEETFLSALAPYFNILGILTVLVFSLVLIYKGVRSLFSK
ncbi:MULTISPECIES: hypothetical protein [Metabacillus]|jgi:hypothetical protein|uniref:Uncharacterized protein n=3 Tax=Metabacillus TaxID=2675233 RepID=A0A179SW57_9BACI|nr:MULTISPECIES: hypothetical protein [Metabacillus]OAS86056.1 hypothetical protein A6K24_22295 [Metabacillus litoralis]QNF30611.1 hypothetical protein HUW50_25965 [Metabacillus sp. KUDC1714]